MLTTVLLRTAFCGTWISILRNGPCATTEAETSPEPKLAGCVVQCLLRSVMMANSFMDSLHSFIIFCSFDFVVQGVASSHVKSLVNLWSVQKAAAEDGETWPKPRGPNLKNYLDKLLKGEDEGRRRCDVFLMPCTHTG